MFVPSVISKVNSFFASKNNFSSSLLINPKTAYFGLIYKVCVLKLSLGKT